MPKKISHLEFIRLVRNKRGNLVRLISNYEGYRKRIRVACTKCNDKTPWSCSARQLIESDRCPHRRKNTQKITHKEYVNIIDKKYNGALIVLSKYKNARIKVKHKCKDCTCGNPSPWYCLPQSLISYNIECPRINIRLDNKEYKTRAIIKGMLPLEEYNGLHKSILHECFHCGSINKTLPRTVIYNKTSINCKSCKELGFTNYSKISIKWLNEIAKKNNIKIIHAENGGEYTIPGTSYKVDGFCKSTKTVYEFYGDIFHGNLDRFPPNYIPNPFSKLTTMELYRRTKIRESKIKMKGYSLVTIWESDYVKMLNL